MKHKHADLIKAWADGAIIQKNNGMGFWVEVNHPDWMDWEVYRIKPTRKTDTRLSHLQLKFTIENDGVMYKFIDVELVK